VASVTLFDFQEAPVQPLMQPPYFDGLDRPVISNPFRAG